MDGPSELRRQSTSDSAQNGILEASSRKERAAPAAQACETCRSRKSRCDEGRPLCKTCKKLGLECKYREPQITKKDKSIEVLTSKVNELSNTQMHIYADIKDIKQKVDLLTTALLHGQTGYGVPTATSAQSAMASAGLYAQQLANIYETVSSVNLGTPQVPDNITALRQVLAWPKVSATIVTFAPASVESQTAALLFQKTPWSWVQQLEVLKHPEPLPRDGNGGAPMAFGFVEANSTVSSLTVEIMRTYSNVFFATFGRIWPQVISNAEFEASIMSAVVTSGFDRTINQAITVTALLIFALGKAAMDFTFGNTAHPGSGARGGIRDSPPGLDLFNEARRRFEDMATQTNIEHIRIQLLMALFYESNCRHLDFWRCVVNASMCVQALGRCTAGTPEDSDSRTDIHSMLKGLHYLCYTAEQSISFALGLPTSGIMSNYSRTQSLGLTAAIMNPEEARQAVHDQTLAELFNMVEQAWSKTNTWAVERSSSIVSFGLSRDSGTLNDLSQQLARWRDTLSVDLQWADTDRFCSSNPPPMAIGMPMFFAELNANYSGLGDMGEVLFTAILRSGYYYTRYLTHRPAVYKALHHPENVNKQDCEDATRCLEATLLWPISAYPCAVWKRVIPSTYVWTQAFVEILLLFYVAQENPILQPAIRENLSTADVDQTILLLMEWVKDMAQVDGLAGWMYEMLTSMYGV